MLGIAARAPRCGSDGQHRRPAGSVVVALLSCLLLTLASQPRPTEGFCYRKSPPKSQESAEQLLQPASYSIWVCVQSADLSADLDKAPKSANVTQIWISMSPEERLKSEAFAKLADKLVKIGIWNSRIKEIDDGAFKGLKELKGLELPRNELTTVKAAWFKDTAKLMDLNLANNQIDSLEIEFLKHLPALVSLDLRGNELVALPGDFVKQLPATMRRLNVYNNPLNYRQNLEAADWSRGKDDKTSELKLKQLRYVFNVTIGCLQNKPEAERSNEAVDKCAEDRMIKDLELIAGGAGGSVNATSATNTTTTTAAAAMTVNTTMVTPLA